jgi:hypothetical protein
MLVNSDLLSQLVAAVANSEEQAKEIERLKREASEMRWRVASKEHPAGAEWCLVFSDSEQFSLAWFCGCWTAPTGSPVTPTHWMPLSQPPVKEGGE